MLAERVTYFTESVIREDYRRRRDILLSYLREAGFGFSEPAGA